MTERVWIVLQGDWEDSYVYAVFSSEAEAERERKRCQREDTGDPPHSWQVTSHEVHLVSKDSLGGVL